MADQEIDRGYIGEERATAELVDAFRGGEERALAQLMERYDGSMRWAARRYLRDPLDIDDAVQDAWTAFTRRADGIRDPERLQGWLRVTTSHAALAIAMKLARVEPVSDVGDVDGVPLWPVAAGGPPDDAKRRALVQAVGRLTVRERQLVELLLVEPRLSYGRISELWGSPIGSIGPTRQRVVAKLGRDPTIARMLADGAA